MTKWKSGDMVWFNRYSIPMEIEYFRPSLARIKLDQIAGETIFFRQWFYGAGYGFGDSNIYVKKRWHYYPAKTCEWLRLFYYNKLSKLTK